MLVRQDRDSADSRPWLPQLQQKAARAAQLEAERERQHQIALQAAAVANQPKKRPTQMVDGYMVYEQNEHLDLKVGPLPRPWVKKLDKRSGR